MTRLLLLFFFLRKTFTVDIALLAMTVLCKPEDRLKEFGLFRFIIFQLSFVFVVFPQNTKPQVWRRCVDAF